MISLILPPGVAVLGCLIINGVKYLLTKRFDRQKFIKQILFSLYLGLVFSALITYGLQIAANADGSLRILGIKERRLLNLVPFRTICSQISAHNVRDLLNIAINTVIMMPFAPFIKALYPKAKSAVCIITVAVFVAGVEAAQYFIGRSCDIDDFLLNVAGTAIALAIYNKIRENK